MKADLAVYGSHNASAVLAIDNKIELVIELERLLNEKHIGVFFYYTAKCKEKALKFLADYIYQEYGISSYDTVIHDYLAGFHEHYFPAKQYIQAHHHREHAYGSLYQSPHDKALIFSFDGGGNDGIFNIYIGEKGKDLELLEHINYTTGPDIAYSYMAFGEPISEIKTEPRWYGNLVYPGKLMGLCAYGNVREEWLGPIFDYYRAYPKGQTYPQDLIDLSQKIGFDVSQPDTVSGQDASDLAATSQKVFEEMFLERAMPHMNTYPDLPIHMTGGCALNIILNTRLVEEFGKEVFVSPNPSDCGLAVGMMAGHLKTPVDITYAGLPILDKHMLYQYVENYVATDASIEEIAKDLAAGKILGVVRGRSEHGPRALGNRSILCNPAIENMKDILNTKVKHREFYRPFAPVVRLDDVQKYFHWDKESRWMTFSPRVRDEWKESLAAITHVDGTARVQTVTIKQNPWLYRLLTEFKKESGVGVLLNTSFNTRGKPIVSSYSEAIQVYRNEELDRLLLDGFYFNKDVYHPNF